MHFQELGLHPSPPQVVTQLSVKHRSISRFHGVIIIITSKAPADS